MRLRHEGRAWRHVPRPREPGARVALACFDMDGVLLDVRSSWVLVHEAFGTANDDNLQRFLDGEIDDLAFIRLDVEKWQRSRGRVHVDDVRAVVQAAPVMRGAYETIHALHARGVKTAIVSGGIDLFAHDVAEKLGIDTVYANGLVVDREGYLTGEGIVRTPLVDKGVAVRAVAEKLGVPQAAIASVGNSFPDVGMFAASGLGIAFRPEDDLIREAAHAVVEGHDLRAVLPHLLP